MLLPLQKLIGLTAVLIVFSFVTVQSQSMGDSDSASDFQDTPVFNACIPVVNGSANPSGVPLPSFPQQFSVQVEASLTNRNSTARFVEYYDGVGQRGRIEGYFSAAYQFGPPTRFTYVADFKTDQGFRIEFPDSSAVNCEVVRLENDRFTQFTFHTLPGPNGTIQIGSANDLFQFAGQLKDQEVYMGQEYARGVLTDHWQYCYRTMNVSYVIDYYFAVEGWGLPQNASRTPILATVFGINQDEDFGIRVINHTYTFTAFDPSPLGDDVFAVPEGVVCKNRKNLKPLPPLDGIKFFSSIFESTNTAKGQSFYSPFFYDRQANLVRYDFTYRNRSDPKSVPGPRSAIHDFTQGVQYLINRDNGFCNVTSLSATGSITPDEVVDDQGNYAIASLLHLLSPINDSASAYVYEGASTVREIPAETWLAFIPVAAAMNFPNVTLENVTSLIYFSRDNWVVNGRNATMPTILRVRVRGTAIRNGTTIQFDFSTNVFNVEFEEPPFEVFDAFECFPPEQTKEVMFTLPVAPTPNTLSLLRSNIRMSLSSFTKAPGSQFGNIQVRRELTLHTH